MNATITASPDMQLNRNCSDNTWRGLGHLAAPDRLHHPPAHPPHRKEPDDGYDNAEHTGRSGSPIIAEVRQSHQPHEWSPKQPEGAEEQERQYCFASSLGSLRIPGIRWRLTGSMSRRTGRSRLLRSYSLCPSVPVPQRLCRVRSADPWPGARSKDF